MGINISIPEDDLAAFCRRWRVEKMSFFGSVLREDFGLKSDVDVLVSFSPDAQRTLFDLVRMKAELEEILGREVDLVSRRGVERSHNYLRRDAIINSSEVVYEA